MPMRGTAIALMLPLLLLSACGSREPAASGNGAASAEGSAAPGDPPANSAAAEPIRPVAPADGAADPVPPPDAVSHPNGYLPPAPAEPEPTGTNASGPDSPATEDEYIRNGQ